MPTLRVLIAAHEAVREVLGSILRGAGCEVLTVSSTSEAIAQAAQFCPEALILETIMPGIDGIRAAKQISQETKCRVLFLEAPCDILGKHGLNDYANALRKEVPDCDVLPVPFEKETLAIVQGRETGWAVAEKSRV